MSIYTKSGDKGETGLLGGKRISKSSLRIEAIGNIDELNACLGLLRAQNPSEKTDVVIRQAQDDIFIIGAELAYPKEQITAPVINAGYVQFLEKHIDILEKKLPPLKQFIIPSGTPYAAYAHIARAICRRAERAIVALHEKEPINKNIIIYLNRLSDLLFMLARADLYENKIPETIWKAP